MRSYRFTPLIALLCVSPYPIELRAEAEVAPFRIDVEGFSRVEGLRIRVSGPSGDYRIEYSEDLDRWEPWETFLLSRTTGGNRELNDAIPEGRDVGFYRAVGILIGAEFHLEGRYGQAIALALAEAPPAVLSALGIDFPALSPGDVPTAAELPLASRNARAYAAVIAALSILAEGIDHEEIQPVVTTAKSKSAAKAMQFSAGLDPLALAHALIADLGSGKLDGTDANGDPISVGSTGVLLSARSNSDLIASLLSFKESTSGLDDLAFELDSDGKIQVLVTATWDAFYWDGADWQ